MFFKTKNLNLAAPKTKVFWLSVFSRLARNKLAMTSLCIIIALTLLCIFAPMFSSVAYDKTDWGQIMQSPTCCALVWAQIALDAISLYAVSLVAGSLLKLLLRRHL
jgi:hypothetical protein